MSEEARIEFDYNQALYQAEQLENMAGDLKNVRKELGNIMEELSYGWTGEAAEIYQKKGSILAEKINMDIENLIQTAGSLRKAAERAKQAELENIRIANERKYR